MSFLQELRSQRMKLIEGLEANHGDINLDIFEDFYPDKAHFIYELLQNAEDAEAKNVSFNLNKQGCIFVHDGKRIFTESDVKSITGIHNTTKKNEPDKIGKFGVGFKSVFVYTETPKIYSQNFSFQIEKLILPSEIEGKPDISNTTVFEFPFNNIKKTKMESYNDIQNGLNDIAETTLLFLNNIESINWKIDDDKSGKVKRIKHSTNHIEITKIINNENIISSHFLRFSKTVHDTDKQLISIAFELEYLQNIYLINSKEQIHKQMKIKPANPGTVAVFFPAKKEASGLRFHLNAPFVPELSRASIKDTPANEPLFTKLAELTSESLHKIKDLHLLTPDFLGILPNKNDNIAERYKQIRDSIISEMNDKPLTPTHYWSHDNIRIDQQQVTTNMRYSKYNIQKIKTIPDTIMDFKTHAPAKHLIQAKVSLKDLLPFDDLKKIFKLRSTPPIWAVGATQRNSNIDRFLDSLEIELWDINHFIEFLYDNCTEYKIRWDSKIIDWISIKSPEWHQQLYSLLYDEVIGKPESQRRTYISKLKDLKIVHLTNGGYSTGNNCFFSNTDIIDDDLFQFVDIKVYSSGTSKTQQENAKEFLKIIGVSIVEEIDQIKVLLHNHYRLEKFNPNIKDIEKFINLIEKEPKQLGIFKDYYIFKRMDKRWSMPNQIYLDLPFIKTGLNSYYSIVNETQIDALSDEYEKQGFDKDKLSTFAKLVGCHFKLEIIEQSTNHHEMRRKIQKDYYLGARTTNTMIDIDWILPYCEEVLQNITLDSSRLIWKVLHDTMSESSSSDDILKAFYRPNQQYQLYEAPSTLVLNLRNNVWIPQKDDDNNIKFVCPADASFSLLPSGFIHNTNDNEWIKAIEFGKLEDLNSKEHKEKEALAINLGFSNVESLERAQEFAKLPYDEQEKFLAKFKSKLPNDHLVLKSYSEALSDNFDNKTNSSTMTKDNRDDLITSPINDVDGRIEKVDKDIMDDKSTEPHVSERIHIVTTVKWEKKNELTRQFLQQEYNGHCQICNATFPKRNGDHYFEGIYLVSYKEARWIDRPGNILCFCPTCAAKWKHGAVAVNPDYQDQIMTLDVTNDDVNSVNIKLCEKNATVRYTARHLLDLQEILKLDKNGC